MSLQILGLSFSLHLLLRKVVAAAEISRFRMVRRWAAAYRQYRFAALARTRTDRRWHDDPTAKLRRPIPIAQEKLDLPVRQQIRDHHWQQFQAEGYMVIRSVVPANIVTNAVRDIAAFVDADLADCSTWYGGDPQLDGVVPMHHAQ